ncbi:MAG: MinD/ParA family protein [Candidatus Micrarchaeota archaeon]|nr:MinD/ParA family protein [Candidatus Micrarchaeota archaeon]MDE1847974.1 MinD/ParA family protein [Candidatus Micrarchaeota archaeon]MDE1864683.1 MinD/ParA family protein [Candidatus Micrarchaeota archaeon]
MSSSRPYIIRISSQKGGVGKTTIAVNVASQLSLLGNRVLLIDTDFINPSVGFHMGLENTNSGVRAVLTGKARLDDTLVVHAPTGMRVLPGEIKAKAFTPTNAQFEKFFRDIEKTGYDFVVIDTPPGFLFDEDIKAFGEALIITTPEMSACTSAARLANHYDKLKVRHSLIVNKFKNKRYELHIQEIKEMYDGEIAAVLPEDEEIPISIAEHIPCCIAMPKSHFADEIVSLADRYSEKFSPEKFVIPKRRGVLSRIFFRIMQALGRR